MNTTFLLDENIAFKLIQLIENFGFLVEHIKKIGKTGIENGEIYKYAEVKNMWIVTKFFSRLRLTVCQGQVKKALRGNLL